MRLCTEFNTGWGHSNNSVVHMHDQRNTKRIEAKRDSRELRLGDKGEEGVAQNSRLGGVFPGEGKSQLGYVLKASGHACVQH